MPSLISSQVGPYVIDEHPARARLERKGEGIPQTHRPDRPVKARGRARDSGEGQRVVGRNGPIGVDAQNLAEPVSQRLRVGGVRVLSYGDVELAVRPKMDRAAIVIGSGTQIIQVENSRLASGFRDIGIRNARGKTADAIVGRGVAAV